MVERNFWFEMLLSTLAPIALVVAMLSFGSGTREALANAGLLASLVCLYGIFFQRNAGTQVFAAQAVAGAAAITARALNGATEWTPYLAVLATVIAVIAIVDVLNRADAALPKLAGAYAGQIAVFGIGIVTVLQIGAAAP